MNWRGWLSRAGLLLASLALTTGLQMAVPVAMTGAGFRDATMLMMMMVTSVPYTQAQEQDHKRRLFSGRDQEVGRRLRSLPLGSGHGLHDRGEGKTGSSGDGEHHCISGVPGRGTFSHHHCSGGLLCAED